MIKDAGNIIWTQRLITFTLQHKMFTAQPQKLTGTPIFVAYGSNPSSTVVWILQNVIKLYPTAFLVLVVAPNSTTALHNFTRIANLEQTHTLSPLKMAICYMHAQDHALCNLSIHYSTLSYRKLHCLCNYVITRIEHAR